MNLPTLTISAANGWMNQEERFSGNIAGKEQKNYTLLHKGELSYNHGNSKLAKYGTVFSLQTYEEALVPRVYHSFRVENGSADFLEYYFATKLPDRELGRLISSGARMDGLLNIGYYEFMGIQMMFPTIAEQNRIAGYFRCLDTLITLHQCKCQIDGCRFQSPLAITWEQRKLEEVITRIGTGLNPRDNFTLNSGGENYYVTIKNFVHGHLFLDDNCDKVDDEALKRIQERSDLCVNDILFTSIGRIGDCYLIKKQPTNWNINESVFTLRPNLTLVEPEYIYHTIHSDIVLNQIINGITGSTFKSIKIGDLKKVNIPVPSKTEQKQIAAFISIIDNLITLHQRKPFLMKWRTSDANRNQTNRLVL